MVEGGLGGPAAPGAARKPYMYGLDLVRFTAALMVMTYHFSVLAPVGPDSTVTTVLNGVVSYPALSLPLRHSAIAVELFFVISGLVIAYSAEGSTALAFVRRRALRVLPTAWVAASLSLAVAACLSLYPLRELVLRYLGALTIWPTGPWIDGTYWTMPIEIAFYVLVFATLALKLFRWVEWLTAALGLASTAYWAIGQTISPVYWYLGLTRAGQDLLVGVGCDIALGVFLWAIFTRGVTWVRVAVALACAWGSALEIAHSASNHADVLHLKDLGATVELTEYFIGVALIVGSIAFARRIESAMGPRTGLWVRRFGLATYPLYLFHPTVGAAIIRGLVLAGAAPYAAYVISCISCIAIALVIAVGIEPQVRRALGLALGGRTPRAVPVTETI